LQCAAVCCSVLQCVAGCCSVLQCVAVCCSVLQCVAVCCTCVIDIHTDTCDATIPFCSTSICALSATSTCRWHTHPHTNALYHMTRASAKRMHCIIYTHTHTHTHTHECAVWALSDTSRCTSHRIECILWSIVSLYITQCIFSVKWYSAFFLQIHEIHIIHCILCESCHTYECVMPHIRMRHVTRMNESCHTYEWVMSHV